MIGGDNMQQIGMDAGLPEDEDEEITVQLPEPKEDIPEPTLPVRNPDAIFSVIEEFSFTSSTEIAESIQNQEPTLQ